MSGYLSLGYGCTFTLALAVTLRFVCSSRGEPVTLRVRRVRLSHSNDARAEKFDVSQSRISDRRVVSPSHFFERVLDGLVEVVIWVVIQGLLLRF